MYRILNSTLKDGRERMEKMHIHIKPICIETPFHVAIATGNKLLKIPKKVSYFLNLDFHTKIDIHSLDF